MAAHAQDGGIPYAQDDQQRHFIDEPSAVHVAAPGDAPYSTLEHDPRAAADTTTYGTPVHGSQGGCYSDLPEANPNPLYYAAGKYAVPNPASPNHHAHDYYATDKQVVPLSTLEAVPDLQGRTGRHRLSGRRKWFLIIPIALLVVIAIVVGCVVGLVVKKSSNSSVSLSLRVFSGLDGPRLSRYILAHHAN